MKKIIFISNNLNSTHDKTRIEEFIKCGAEVEVYGYTRENENGKKRKSEFYTAQILGHVFPAYKSRISVYYKTLKQLRKEKKGIDCIYYFFGLDITAVFLLLGKNVKYVYEEADLVYTYMSDRIIRNIFKLIDKYAIRNSYLTALTSEGFIRYHFGNNVPDNVVLVPNRLNESVLKVEYSPKTKDPNKGVRYGFVGAPRFKAIHNFIDVFCRNFPNKEFHIWGGPIPEDFEDLKIYKNCIFHGYFSSPVDLPKIYSSLDVVLSTYDSEFDNVRFAEPNKIYESIYFETPIIVSTNTFLEEKVKKMGIGFSLDATNENEIVRFVKDATYIEVQKCVGKIKSIDKNECINKNDDLIDRVLNDR